MHYFFIDTCSWLNLVKSRNADIIVSAMENMINSEMLTLVVPELIKDEFERNKERVIKSTKARFNSDIKVVKDLLKDLGGEHKQEALNELNNIDLSIPELTQAASEMSNRVLEMMNTGIEYQISETAKIKAVQRALDKRAPFHKDKNSVADAVLIEAFDEFKAGVLAQEAEGNFTSFYFVTFNKHDFSLVNGDIRKPHDDFDDIFCAHAHYFLDVVSAINEADEDAIDDVEIELQFDGEGTRQLNEIIDNIGNLTETVWYNRHLNLIQKVESGEVQVVPKESSKHGSHVVHEHILEGAKASAQKLRELGLLVDCKDDFEWGMINGKLSALRWVLGDEWDMLDT